MKTHSIQEMLPLGYGNPDAKISYIRQIENGSLHPDVAKKASDIIQAGSCMVAINEKDDGCIDGRLAQLLVFLEGIEGEDFNEIEIHDLTAHNRAKVAGGGYITSLAMEMALNSTHQTVDEALQYVVQHLASHGVYCGTHTGDHGSAQGVDCGANDRFEDIVSIMYGAEYGDKILESVRGAWPLCQPGSVDDDTVALVKHNSHKNIIRDKFFAKSDGRARYGIIMDGIADAQKSSGSERPVSVSKHLGGSHKEAFIILNTVDGKTFSQAAFHAQLQEAFPDVAADNLPQAFVVDLPRIAALAQVMAKGRTDENESNETALVAGLAFQFAVAATLTDGSLRTFVVE